MSLDPLVHWRFDHSPGVLDPRAVFTRAGVGMSTTRRGGYASVPSNVMRPWFDPSNGKCEGVLIEGQRTNLLQYSTKLNTAPWSVTGLSIVEDAITAPDGTLTGNSLTSLTSLGGDYANVLQSFTITANRGIAFSLFVKGKSSQFVRLAVFDGLNYAGAWFNIAAATAGTTFTSSGTVAIQQAYAEAWGDGWTRVTIEVTTVTSTSWLALIYPASADGADVRNGDSIYAWGAQAEADSGLVSSTSPIITAGATATRNADNLYLPLNSNNWTPLAGTVYLEFVLRHHPLLNTGQTMLLGGIGDTFSNTIYVGRSPTGIWGTFIGSGALSIILSRPGTVAKGQVFRVAMAWGTNDTALALNGSVISSGATFVMAGATPRIGVGLAPWGTSSSTSVAFAVCRGVKYYPRRISNADLTLLTSE